MSSKKRSFVYQSLLILLLNTVAYGEMTKSSIETQIIDKISASMFPSQKISAWGETADQKNIIQQSTKMTPAEHLKNARLILVSKRVPENIPSNAVLITNEYSLLAKEPRIVGAFFWQKGRPNILFLRKRLQEENITLSKEFDKYIEDEL